MTKYSQVVTTTTINGSGIHSVSRTSRSSHKHHERLGVFFKHAFGPSGALRIRNATEASYRLIERACDGNRRG